MTGAMQIKARRSLRPNTTTWVDERYSQLLARQAVDSVNPSTETGSTLLTLASIRRSPLYLAERPAKVGFGVKRGTRVFHVDCSEYLAGLGIYTIDYDRNGKVVWKSMLLPPKYVITRHALERLFLRLRTNSFDDVSRAALAPIVNLEDAPRPNMAAEIVVVGRGQFRAVSETVRSSHGEVRVAWILKTFIDKE